MITYEEVLETPFAQDFRQAGANWINRGFELGEQLATLAVVLRLAESVCAAIISRAPEGEIEEGISLLMHDFEEAVRERIQFVQEARGV